MLAVINKIHSLMHGGLLVLDKRTCTLSTMNYFSVKIVDGTAPFIDAHIWIYMLRIKIFA